MKSIKVKSAKFFKPIRPKRDQFLRVDIDFKNVEEINYVAGLGLVVNAFCIVDKKSYQYVCASNNIEAINLLDRIEFNVPVAAVKPKKEVKKSKKN